MTGHPPIRVGLIGYGLGGAVFHAPIIAVTPGLRLTTIITGNPERRERAARDHAGVRVADSADWIFEHAREHELVVIATSNRSHVPLALASLAAGLAVVVDKPLAATAADARRVVEEARRRRLFLSVYHERRWDSEMLTARRLIDEGALGKVLRFESRLERWRPTPKPGWRELAAPDEAGGLLYDLGSHLIDQSLVLFGAVTRVYAELARRRPGVAVDDDVFIALAHASGVRSHLWTSAVAAQPGPRMRILGTRAAYVKVHADIQEAALRSGARPDAATWGVEPQEQWGRLGVGDEACPVRSEPGAYQRFYAGVVAALREGAAPPVNPEDAVAGLEIIEAAQRSAAEGRTVGMSEYRTAEA